VIAIALFALSKIDHDFASFFNRHFNVLGFIYGLPSNPFIVVMTGC
jgi:hypothetical protein